MRIWKLIGISLISVAGSVSSAWAGTLLYANSAGSDGIQIFNVDVAAGTEKLVDHLSIAVGNGRGVVTVGDTLYYTDASSGNVSTYTLSTHHDNGKLFTVTGSTGLATIAYDGSSLYLGDYSGTNHAYKYSLTGTLQATLTLNSCTSFCDGLEYANGQLVSNEKDGGFGSPSVYDAYPLSGGAPSHPSLITSQFGLTGIAFDGTYYYTSDIFNDRLAIYSATGAFVKNIVLADGHHTDAIEDLSVDYAIVLTSSPEPSTMLLLIPAAGLVALRSGKRSQISRVS